MSGGWIKLHRKLLDSRVFANEGLLRLWLYCLCRANHEKNYVQMNTGKGKTEVEVSPGEFIFGRNSVAKDLKMNPSTLYKRMKKLEKMGNINIQSNTHYSTVSICNWGIYQSSENVKEQVKEQASNNQVTTKEQPSNTDKNDNNDKNEKNNYTQFVDLWNSVNECNLRITDKKRKQIRARLDTYSVDELKKSIVNRSKDPWINGDGKKYKSNWDSFWRNDEKPERYLEVNQHQSQENQKAELWETY